MDRKFVKKIDAALERYLPKDRSSLSRAMRYSVMAGGKRFRPYLCVEAAKLFGGQIGKALPAACAIEMIHTFTLIHDDLPAMDDSDLRRGKPTCHKAFGEEIALLAGDALNTLAFEVIARHCDRAISPDVSAELSNGLIKVVRGQVIDLESEGKWIPFKRLEAMHLLKTAALIETSLKIGAMLAKAPKKKREALARYGRHLGLAFQIADDILDVSQTSRALGKPAGLDRANKKSTYVTLLGVSKARKAAELHRDRAVKCLEPFGRRALAFAELAEFVVRRRK